MKRRPPAPQRKSRREWTALHFLGAIFVIAIMAVVLAVLFAPEKPLPPPPSKTTYQAKPADRGYELPPMPGPRRDRRNEPVQLAVNDEPVVEEGEGCIVQGVVTDAKTGKPVPMARVGASINWREIEEQDWDHFDRYKSTFTTPAGKYALRLPVPAKYTFNAWSNGYLRKEGKEITLPADAKQHKLDFSLSRGASISGRVTENRTGNPVRNMGITADGQKAQCEAASGEDGRYTVSGLVPGTYKVMIALRGQQRLDMGHFGELGDFFGGAKSLSSIEREIVIKLEDEEVRGVDFVVEPTGQVWGYVLTYENEPVSGADIVLCSSTTIVKQVLDMAVKQSAPITAGADRDGYYEIVGVPLNKEWRLFTFPEKHAPQLTESFLLTSSQRVARIDIYVLRGSDVYGVVVDPDRAPLPDAEVFCLPATSALLGPLTTSQTFESARSIEDGSFKFTNIPVGDYQIYGAKTGYKYTTTGEPFHSDGKNDVVGLTIVLTPVEKGNMTIYGTVTDTDGAPISDVALELGGIGAEAIEDGVSKETKTDTEGKYAFYEINTGFYLLMASRPGYETKTVTNVKYDEPTDIVLEKASTVSGIVLVRETGKPPGYFSVRALGAGGSPVSLMQSIAGQSFSTPDGRFEITVKPGEYTLEARATGFTPGRTNVSVSQGASVTGVVIEVSESGGQISGRVVTADSRSASGAVVALSEAGDVVPIPLFNVGGQGSVQTGPDGEFSFQRIGAGAYSISVRLEGYAPSLYGPITLGDRQVVNDLVIRLEHGNVLQGYVAFNGQLEPGAMVTVVGNGVTEMTTADANGQYRFENLPAGSYVGSAVSLNNLTTGSFSPLHGRIDVVQGQINVYNFGEPTNTALAALCTPPPAGGTMGFALLLFPGAPSDIVSLNLTNPASWFQDSSEMATYVAGMSQIDLDGYFRIDNLIQGEYRLDIIYTNLGEIMSGSVSMVHSGPVVIEQGKLNELELQVGTP